MFDTENMRMTDWSKNASKKGLPRQWQLMPTKVLNVLFDPYCKDVMFLHSHDMFVLLDITKVYNNIHRDIFTFFWSLNVFSCLFLRCSCRR